MYSFVEYSADIAHTAQYPNQGDNVVYPAMGVAGEAGELCDKIKKYWRNTNECDAPMSSYNMSEELKYEIVKEMGDVLWYLNALAQELHVSLHDVARANVLKVKDRAKRNVIKSTGDNR